MQTEGMTTSDAAEPRVASDSPSDVRVPAGPEEQAAPRVHVFKTSGDAYNESQWNDAIRRGDVLHVPSENAAAVLVGAWPTRVTDAGDAFHGLAPGITWDAVPGIEETDPPEDYSAAARIALALVATPHRYEEIAREELPPDSFRYGQAASFHGFDVDPRNWAVCTPCTHFDPDQTMREVLVAQFTYSVEANARRMAEELSQPGRPYSPPGIVLVRPVATPEPVRPDWIYSAAAADLDATLCHTCKTRSDWHDAVTGACPDDDGPHPSSIEGERLAEEWLRAARLRELMPKGAPTDA